MNSLCELWEDKHDVNIPLYYEVFVIQDKHDVNTPLYCEVCDNAYKSEESLSEHYQEHMVKSEGVKCDICGRFFKHKYALKVKDKQLSFWPHYSWFMGYCVKFS